MPNIKSYYKNNSLPNKTIQTEQHFITEAYFAGFWRRAFAQIIDGIILLFVSSVIVILLPENIVQIEFEGAKNATEAISALLAIIFTPLFESSKLQATPGKTALGIKITDTQGNRISFLRALARFIVETLFSTILLFGYLLMLFTPKKQTFHDIICHTYALREIHRIETDTIIKKY